MSTVQCVFDSDSEDVDVVYMQLQIDAADAWEEYAKRRLACKQYVRDKRAAAKTAKLKQAAAKRAATKKPMKPMKPRSKAKKGMRCTNEELEVRKQKQKEAQSHKILDEKIALYTAHLDKKAKQKAEAESKKPAAKLKQAAAKRATKKK